MSICYATYNLQNNYVHNWIVAGPQAIPVDLSQFPEQDRIPIVDHYYEKDSGILEPPVDWAEFTIDDTELKWTYYRCRDDHLVDLSTFYHSCHYLRAWACTNLNSPTVQKATFVLTTNGPADVWVNGEHVLRQVHFQHQIPHSVPFQVTLHEGHNEILVRFEEVAIRECPYVMALEVLDLQERATEADLSIPVSVKDVERRQTLEHIFQAAYMERDVYAHAEKVSIVWPENIETSASLAIRIQTSKGQIYAESLREDVVGKRFYIAIPYQIPEGDYHILLMPQPKEYYEGNMRITRRIGMRAARNKYSQTAYKTFTDRRIEALIDASQREIGIYSEIAKMALGRWKRVMPKVFIKAIEGINQRQDCSDFYLVGLLGMMHRYWKDPAFPDELREPLESCVLGFKYWADEPGEDAMWYWSENHQILFHTCEILAGQLYPDRIFTNTNQTGEWHRQKGENLALEWLHKRGTTGFQEWDSNCYFEQDVLALSHLIDLVETPQVYDLAAVVLDKMCFSLAINSYKGVFGSTHGRTYSRHIQGGRLESTSGISRLLWGMGTFNAHLMGTVSLACQEQYLLPPIIAQIAADLPEEMWNHERHTGTFEETLDRTTGTWEVNKVTYKTPDYMLCSAQDHAAGKPGNQQHIWQATLGPDAVVFVTHPACCSEDDSHRPGFWHGNVLLPRVAQWKDVLIAVHNLPETDWMGFTHAYFPAVCFDEYTLPEDNNGHRWAFARTGEGYLAITASQGMQFITDGDSAYRELRSYGSHNVWLCHMGRATLDGTFAEFQEKILALDITFEELAIRCATLRGETLAFGWEGPLLRDGKKEPISDFKHYENLYCVADLPAEKMEIRHRDQAIRLNFA
jgi:hypothetical protein